MNKTENLLVTVMEECSEIQQATSKALRFGIDESHGFEPTNGRKIVLEFYDLMAIIHRLQLDGILPSVSIREEEEMISARLRKIDHYQNVSRELGTLKE